MATLINELAVMNSVAEIMNDLTKDEQRRVITWLLDYYGIYADEYSFDEEDGGIEPMAVAIEDGSQTEEEADDAPLTFESFYAKVAPKTAIQKIVTSAYWIETQNGKESWKSFEVNKLLKSIDVKISSVSGTLAIDAKKETPYIVVLQKSGDSMQSRKTFSLSDEGKRFVEDRLA